MEFIRRASGSPNRLGILPGTFNPVTVAHLGLASAAGSRCDEVVFVLPRILPHKEFSGVSFDQRLELLDRALGSEDRYSLAVADAGLFADIANECREAYGAGVRLSFLCGRDAAERIAAWDYGRTGAFVEMLRQFDLLVARRNGEYVPPSEFSGAMERLELSPGFDLVSATEVRARLVRGEPWEHLVPAAIRQRVRELYGCSTELD